MHRLVDKDWYMDTTEYNSDLRILLGLKVKFMLSSAMWLIQRVLGRLKSEGEEQTWYDLSYEGQCTQKNIKCTKVIETKSWRTGLQ